MTTNVDYVKTTSLVANVVSATVIIGNVIKLAVTVMSKILLNFAKISSLTSVIVRMNTLLFVILVNTTTTVLWTKPFIKLHLLRINTKRLLSIPEKA